jgi:hypothetical protein
MFYVLLMSSPIIGQVGINTTAPVSTLDINGTLKVRSVATESNPLDVRDSILVVNQSWVKTISVTNIIDQALPSLVKAHFAGSGVVNLSLATGSQQIPFDTEDFDLNSEYDTSTFTFTAKQNGYYRVGVQIEADPTIAISSSFGVEVLKNSVVVNRNEFANIGVLGTNVTPPLRNVNTVLQLAMGDTITFNVVGTIAMGSVNLLQNFQDSFFSIEQIR